MQRRRDPAGLCGHLRFDHETVATANCIPCRMPYITSMFMPRLRSNRPLPVPVPVGSKNFAFISQFVEIPDDIVFTVEYSVRAAQMAVYQLLGIDRKVPAISPRRAAYDAHGFRSNPGADMKILMVLTSHVELGDTGKKTGFWLEEFAAHTSSSRTQAPRSRWLRRSAASLRSTPRATFQDGRLAASCRRRRLAGHRAEPGLVRAGGQGPDGAAGVMWQPLGGPAHEQ